MRDSDKGELIDISKGFNDLGYEIYATKGTAKIIEKISA
ncbi:MAG: hypothetical protein L6V93_02725 [Clostridiales bacterium]|nr:MAG: hypothetical protein L6V93_02725 [Clostridiales bacterium]